MLDVHLRAPVDEQQIEPALFALDRSITAQLIEPAVLRLTIPARPVWRGFGGEEMRVGDVERLHHLFVRLLVPLHQEIGIERVEMGGRMAAHALRRLT